MILSCVTGKMTFYSAKDAKKAVNQQKASRKRGHAPSRHYYTCEHCGNYHLTSKSKAEVRRNKKTRDMRQERRTFAAELREKNTVSWLLDNQVKWLTLEILDADRAVATYMVGTQNKRVMLRNE